MNYRIGFHGGQTVELIEILQAVERQVGNQFARLQSPLDRLSFKAQGGSDLDKCPPSGVCTDKPPHGLDDVEKCPPSGICTDKPPHGLDLARKSLPGEAGCDKPPHGLDLLIGALAVVIAYLAGQARGKRAGGRSQP